MGITELSAYVSVSNVTELRSIGTCPLATCQRCQRFAWWKCLLRCFTDVLTLVHPQICVDMFIEQLRVSLILHGKRRTPQSDDANVLKRSQKWINMNKHVSKCLKFELQLLFSSPFSPFSGRGPLAIYKAPGTLSDGVMVHDPSHCELHLQILKSADAEWVFEKQEYFSDSFWQITGISLYISLIFSYHWSAPLQFPPLVLPGRPLAVDDSGQRPVFYVTYRVNWDMQAFCSTLGENPHQNIETCFTVSHPLNQN